MAQQPFKQTLLAIADVACVQQAALPVRDLPARGLFTMKTGLSAGEVQYA